MNGAALEFVVSRAGSGVLVHWLTFAKRGAFKHGGRLEPLQVTYYYCALTATWLHLKSVAFISKAFVSLIFPRVTDFYCLRLTMTGQRSSMRLAHSYNASD